ncbi:MAG: CHC2 zinc finger domain-containing protein [Chlamydiota bacterium]|nr:CHC2 zinc finger domain-containing protein [Chlamydiota bacterium]
MNIDSAKAVGGKVVKLIGESSQQRNKQVDKETIDLIKDRVNLVDLVEKYVDLKKNGSWHVGLCPFHDEKTPSFFVEANHYHCYGCNEHGDVFDFLQRHLNLSFTEALDTLASDYRISRISSMSPTERKDVHDSIKRKREEENKALTERREAAADEAKKIWNSSSIEPENEKQQRYLYKKGIFPKGIRFGKNPEGYESIIIPIKNLQGELRSLQFISVDDEGRVYKYFLSNGEKQGNYFATDEITNAKSFFVAEGYATAISVHECSKTPVIAAMDSGNLLSVVEILSQKYPNSEITITADGPNEKSNTGQEKAEEAAKIYGCKVVLPLFPVGKELNREGKLYTDFNDLHQACGVEEVKNQLTNSSRTVITPQKEDLKNIDQEVILNGIPKKITDMASLDKRFAQLEAPGQPCVLINRIDAQPISESDFKRRLSSEVVCIGVDNSGNPIYISASKYWQGNSRKCVYKKIVFTNNPVDDSTYNLFAGFGVEPRKGSCEKILKHIEEVICYGCQIKYNAFLNLLSWQIKNVGKPSRIIVVLKSKEQQSGKGILLLDVLSVIWGESGFTTSDIGQIITRFNDTIRGKSYIYLDEALFSGDRKSSDAIKSLATCTRMGVETKGIPIVQFPIAVNLFLATNHDDAAYVEESDARYWILEVSPHRVDDTNYFEDLYEEIVNGGREAFMDYLLSLEISGFVPIRDVPKDNEAKEEMIRNSINPYDARKWLEECMEFEMLLGCKKDSTGVLYKQSDLPWFPWKSGEELVNGVFFEAYKEWQKSVKSSIQPRPTASKQFGVLLNKVGFKLRIEGQRRRTIPPIDTCKELLKKMVKKNGK